MRYWEVLIRAHGFAWNCDLDPIGKVLDFKSKKDNIFLHPAGYRSAEAANIS
jgi:hypothetical protein